MNDNSNQITNNSSSLQKQEQDLKNIEFKEFDIKELLKEDSFIELKYNTVSNLSASFTYINDLLNISKQSKCFRATVSQELLSKFNDGTYSTIIRDSNGHIISHAGFEQISPIDFTPLIVFKIASLVTSQYYLHHISEQLNYIKENLDFLKRNIYQETIGEILSIGNEIDRKIKDPNTEDDSFLNTLEKYRRKIEKISIDYKQKLNVEKKIKIESSFFESNIKKLKNKESDCSLYLKIIAICEYFTNVINSLILNIHMKNKRTTSYQKNLIETNMRESSLLNNCDEFYDSISNQIPKLISNFEKEFAHYKELGHFFDKSTYKNSKVFKKRMKEDFSLKSVLERYKPKALIKNTCNVLGIPTLIARKIEKQRKLETNKYLEELLFTKQKIKEMVQSNNKKIERLIGDKELIYIVDNQQNKRLFMKIS